jgi:hypothetical protein
MTAAAGLALPFLLDRDAHDEEEVEEFYKGICMEADYSTFLPGDARAAFALAMLRRYGSDDGRAPKGGKTSNTESLKSPGPFQLCLALKAYSKWQMQKLGQEGPWKIADFGADERAYAVWEPGMRLINGVLRHPYR